MTEERTFKSILVEANDYYNRSCREYEKEVSEWKIKFEVISKQKHKYQEESRNVKKEIESCTQENNKLKGEIDSLRQIVNRDQRSEKCPACQSFKHTLQTLKEVYENTLDQKNNHISYLENRIKELERSSRPNIPNHHFHGQVDHARARLSSPDSTSIPNSSMERCSSDKSNKSHDSSNRVDPKKSSAGVEPAEGCAADTSNKKSHDQESTDPSPDRLNKGLKLRLPKVKRSRYSEDPSPEQQKRTKLDTTIEIHQDGMEEATIPKRDRKRHVSKPNIIVPETCAFDLDLIEEEEDKRGSLEDNENLTVMPPEDRKNKWNVATDSSSSENEESLLKVKGDQDKGKGQRSWLKSMLTSPDLNTKRNETEARSRLKKNRSDPSELLRSPSLEDEDGKSMSQGQCSLKVIPIQGRKNPVKKSTSKYANSSTLGSGSDESNISVKLNEASGLSSQLPIDIQSDNESPLILRSSGRIDTSRRIPEVDVLFEDSDESPKDKSKNVSKNTSLRKVRSQKSRSQERSPDLDLSGKERKKKQREKASDKSINNEKSDKNSRSKVLANVEDNLKNKTKQTTLSQAFLNSNQHDMELQEAIERSLQEKHSPKSMKSTDDVETKENTPPFKVPSVPKQKNSRNRNYKSSSTLNKTMSPSRQRKPSDDLTFDDTIAPSSLPTREKGVNEVMPINGSLDPAIELSQLCRDSQSLGHFIEDSELILEKNALDKNTKNTHDDIESLDFRLEDLENNGNIPKTSTCVDIGDDSQSIPSSSTSVKFGSGRLKGKGRKLQIGGDTEEIVKEEEKPTKQIMDDSFDVRPKKDVPGFAYVDVVRGKDERRKLKAYFCQECHEYYKDTGMTDEEIQKKAQECSRHRATHVPPSTPEHFWSIGFPDTPECEERGYINRETSEEKQRGMLRARRNKYRKLFKSKDEDTEKAGK